MTPEDLCSEGMFTVQEAEAFSRISDSQLYYLMGIKEIPFTKSGRKRLIPKKGLVAYLAARTFNSR